MSSGPYWCHDCETEHSSKCPWDVVKDKDKEIERLRSRNIETVYQENRALEAEIERLRGRVKTLEEMGTSESARLSGLLVEERKRIEELEKAMTHTTPEFAEWLASAGKHIITTKQIRAAWIEMLIKEHRMPVLDVFFGEGMRKALGMLNIVQCEGYGCKGGYVNGVKCPNCEGEGFKIRHGH